MLRVELNNAKPGMKLALPVEHPRTPGTTLLRINYQLEVESIERMTELGVRSIWVRYPSLDFLEKYISSDVAQAQSEIVRQMTDTFSMTQH